MALLINMAEIFILNQRLVDAVSRDDIWRADRLLVECGASANALDLSPYGKFSVRID